VAAATVERALRTLRLAVRSGTGEEQDRRLSRSGAIPDDLRTEAAVSMYLGTAECVALDDVIDRLACDERFEYMGSSELDAAGWRYACQACLQRSVDHTQAFIAAYARTPESHTCYFPIEHLTVPATTELYGVTFLPAGEVEKPASPLWTIPQDASVMAVACRGTSRQAMVERARPDAEHALRLLRATLREHPEIVDRQLRFRLGETHWFEDRLSGWSVQPDQGWELELHESLLEYARRPSIATLPLHPRNDIERRANRALVWIEQFQLSVDPLIGVLSLFYALETLLGDRDGGQKGPRLAVRRATLGAIVRESFQHPIDVVVLYDEVRSRAVHGDEPLPIGERTILSLAWSVRQAVSEFLTYAQAQRVTRRSKVVAALESHEHWSRIIDELIRPNPEWEKHIQHLPNASN
jgi:hypothetical protein